MTGQASGTGSPSRNSDTVCVAVLAHPDDEVFIAGTLRCILERGDEVHCVWMTSGEASGGAARREAELARAVSILGLEPGAVHLARFPNRGLLPRLQNMAEWLGELFLRLAPDEVFTTAYEGGHIDHDAVNWAVHKAWTNAAPEAVCQEFPLYNRTGPRFLRGWRVNDFPPDADDVRHTRCTLGQLECKFAMMRAYRSQWADLLPFRLLMPARKFLEKGEPHRLMPMGRDYLAPPHAGILNYERNPGLFHFADFSEAVKAASRE